MRKKLDKVFTLPSSGQHKIYQAKKKKKAKKSLWQYIYSLFF
ncbi:MAG: hypothetical protein PHO91_03685 [Patescibacteria group bacterium]|nr:hypothetical protein [Patescibacteria group bacterium]